MIYLILFLSQVFFCSLLYLIFKKKFDKTIASDDLKNEIDSLIIAFNRNADSNINILESRIFIVKDLMNKLDEKLTTLKLREQSFQKKEQLLPTLSKDNGNKKKVKKKAEQLKSLKTIKITPNEASRTKKKNIETSIQEPSAHEVPSGYGEPLAPKDANRKVVRLLTKKNKIDFASLNIVQKVHFLKSHNKSDKEIATELDLSRSEVKLMTNL